MQHFEIVTADGALEAAPAMGVADIILDLVSSGTTLRENNLKEIDGGRVLESQVAISFISIFFPAGREKKKPKSKKYRCASCSQAIFSPLPWNMHIHMVKIC